MVKTTRSQRMELYRLWLNQPRITRDSIPYRSFRETIESVSGTPKTISVAWNGWIVIIHAGGETESTQVVREWLCGYGAMHPLADACNCASLKTQTALEAEQARTEAIDDALLELLAEISASEFQGDHAGYVSTHLICTRVQEALQAGETAWIAKMI